MEKESVCICKTCGKSSNVGNECIYEDSEKMAFCPTYIKIKPQFKKK